MRHGASLEEIGQILRHLTPETTRIYAKVDNAAVRIIPSRRPEPLLALATGHGMSAWIERHQAFLKRFMTFRFGATPGNINDIAPDDILAFVAQPAPTRSCRVVSWPTHLRSLFRFLFRNGKTRRNPALSIPRSARSDFPPLPSHVTPDEIRQLIEAVHTDDALGRRNHAMLLLMARLGLRAPEVIAIRIEDIACVRARS